MRHIIYAFLGFWSQETQFWNHNSQIQLSEHESKLYYLGSTCKNHHINQNQVPRQHSMDPKKLNTPPLPLC